MQVNNVYAIYFSPTGATEKAVVALADGTRLPFETIDLTLPRSRLASGRSFAEDDMVVVGLPVYGGRLPKNLDDFFPGLSGNKTPAVALVMYGNREYEDALMELKLRLEDRGFIVKAGAAFIGEHTFSNRIATGRPDAGDLAIAASFGRKIAMAVRKDISGELTVKGNYPFMAKGYDPTNPGPLTSHVTIATTDSCTHCGLCAENCPWAAIDADDFKTVNRARCLLCFRCVKYCPANAKQVTDEKFLALLPQFEMRLNSQRREPELFLPL